MTLRCGIVGSGNVASHLARGLHRSGVRIVAVTSPTPGHAEALADEVDAKACVISEMPHDLDIIIIATSDSAVIDAASALPPTDAIVAHTSGSIPLKDIATIHRHAAVLYPLQTFSRDVDLDLTRVPFFIEATEKSDLERLRQIAGLISPNIYEADSERRTKLHIAGVLGSNFPIYLLGRCEEILEQAGYPLDVLRPLLEASIDKAFTVGPSAALTGPARRGDIDTIRRHIEALDPDTAAIYTLISKQILETYHTNKSHNLSKMSSIPYDLRRIRGIVFDIDGVLSPTTIPMGDDGIPQRMANLKDGYAMVQAVRAGLKMAVISGGTQASVVNRFKIIGIEDIFLGVVDKLPVLRQWMEKEGLHREEVAYVGDDVPDLEPMAWAGLAITPSDGSIDTLRRATYITTAAGGQGVAREVLEQILRTQGTWPGL